ncbi:tetratricopeptide repeat protein [Nodosilinea sp. E11]|uniref:tetratricopeptide repeat protein n=1 Tax=Nodosilinea sp. E11 TaxID=3037479 RepID=UPI00293500EC|nr:tetratricopeptide repeat protein [Nodosilinea sp. E11]WOD38338.1 tetratricopeptide repeat protein [Nodosilinea sp. E11]
MTFTVFQRVSSALRPLVAPVTPSPDQAGVASEFASGVERSVQTFQQWYTEGETLANARDYAGALRCFEAAAIAAPRDVPTLIYQAVCLIHLEQFQSALAMADRVLAIAPNHSQGWLFRGVALQRLGRYPEAYASYANVEAS